MKMDPKRYTYQVSWNDDPKGYKATVVEFPHLSSIHPQGPAEALEILESKVYHELQWWEQQGDPPVRPVGQNIVTRRPKSVAEGFLVWDTVIWDTSSSQFPNGHAYRLFNTANSGDTHRTNSRGDTGQSYETFTHLGLRMLFQSRERLSQAFNNVTLSLRTYGSRPIFETHASAFLNPSDEGDVEVPLWTPNEGGGPDPEPASHCAFIALPEPQTLPPRTPYHVLVEVGGAYEFFRELEQVWRHDGDRVHVYYEIRVFLYGRRRERRL